jgi:type IV pilus biogenesis protein CpaD/CtpE
MTNRREAFRGVFAIVIAAGLSACATVKLQAPDEPIEINLNVKIDQEVRVKLDKEVEELIADNPDIF